jgi:hypothetical protein
MANEQVGIPKNKVAIITGTKPESWPQYRYQLARRRVDLKRLPKWPGKAAF